MTKIFRLLKNNIVLNNFGGGIKLSLIRMSINPGSEAIIGKKDFEEIGRNSFSQGEVSISNYEPNKVTLKTNFPDAGFLVLSDQYYPGWRAYVDGKATKIYKTNGILRGVLVPPGRHEIVFRYLPRKFLIASAISLISLVCIVAFIKHKHVASPASAKTRNDQS